MASQAASPSLDPASPADPDEIFTGERALTFALLYGPIVQFAQPTAGQAAPSVIALPPQLPLSVDPVFTFPAGATLPDNLAHFCFAPILKLHDASEVMFTLTDSHGVEIYGVSVQVLCQYSTKNGGPKHRPVALVMLSGRPLFSALSRLLHLLLPFVQQVGAI